MQAESHVVQLPCMRSGAAALQYSMCGKGPSVCQDSFSEAADRFLFHDFFKKVLQTPLDYARLNAEDGKGIYLNSN